MVLVSGEATIFGLSIVDVSGGAAIRDDISLTARRTSLDKIFQTQRRRTHTRTHARTRTRTRTRIRKGPLAPRRAPRPFNVESVNVQPAIEKYSPNIEEASWTPATPSMGYERVDAQLGSIGWGAGATLEGWMASRRLKSIVDGCHGVRGVWSKCLKSFVEGCPSCGQ